MARTPIQPADTAPLLVTAHFDAEAFAILDGLRRRYFPVELNRVPAHVSLFHHLPGERVAEIQDEMAMVCTPQTVFTMLPVKLVPLGRGVAIAYASPELDALRAALARTWAAVLTPQDRQRFRAHVTIQNKVAPNEAKGLLRALDPSIAPLCRVEGLDLWRYRSGPWEHVATIPFGPAPQ